MKLAGKVAIVTGAAQGIGQEIATALAQEGSDLAVVDVNLEQAEKAAQELAALGRKTMALKVDVSRSVEIDEMVNKILDKFGKIDILVNNAGITKDNLLLRMKEEEWDLVISINLKGTFNCLKAVTRPMIKARSGKIVNIASIIGLAGNAGQANYAASKAGVIALTKSAAKELASRNINVNAVAPGFIQTAMTHVLPAAVKEEMLKRIPLAKFGEVKDVAKAVLFLAGPDSDYITGQVVVVDGGMVMNFM
ncbi:MAG: 3-oxoacyl-[acyl-carrier-protein] reductase [Elusimicrobia bacterium]|nr:3-oxoacyl-[acyl-carrier-protein] reductase [Elusimicrobiota bacterium]